MKEPIKVLFVCLGNICRSPLAEGIFNNKIRELSLQRFLHSDSCGTSDWHLGERPDNRSMQIAGANGIQLVHQGRQINVRDFDEFDYILAMDEDNLHSLKQIHDPDSDPRARLMLMREFDPEPGPMNVPDPYFGGEDGFLQVYEILDRSCDALLKFIQHNHQIDV